MKFTRCLQILLWIDFFFPNLVLHVSAAVMFGLCVAHKLCPDHIKYIRKGKGNKRTEILLVFRKFECKIPWRYRATRKILLFHHFHWIKSETKCDSIKINQAFVLRYLIVICFGFIVIQHSSPHFNIRLAVCACLSTKPQTQQTNAEYTWFYS